MERAGVEGVIPSGQALPRLPAGMEGVGVIIFSSRREKNKQMKIGCLGVETEKALMTCNNSYLNI